MVGVVLHERDPAGPVTGHDLEDPHQHRRLPVALAPEAVAVGHEPLDGDTRELAQASEILEVSGERVEVASVEERPQAYLLGGGVAQRAVPGTPRGELGHDRVAVLVLRHDIVDGVGRSTVHRGDELIDAVGVDRRPEPQLDLDLVALGNGDIAHVVAEAGHPQLLGGMPAGGGAGPRADPAADGRVAGVPGHRLAPQGQTGLDVTELAVAVGGLVQVHEVHVDLGPGQGKVGLGVQVQERLAQDVEPGDPGLGRRKGVHPRHHPDALVGAVGIEASATDTSRIGEDGLPDDGHADLGAAVQQRHDVFGLGGHLAQGGLAVQLLTTGEEPDLEVFSCRFHPGSSWLNACYR